MIMLSMSDDLAQNSWTVQKDGLSLEKARALRLWGEEQRKQGLLRPAGIGSSASRQEQIRGDEILWLSPEQSPLIHEIWQDFEKIRLKLNQDLYLGMDHLECHLAVYPAGRGYDAHLDQPRLRSVATGERVLSMVLYLNENWAPEHEGELCILDPESSERRVLQQILPVAGTMVLFRSDSILHEVRAPRRERWSLTGWFRRR